MTKDQFSFFIDLAGNELHPKKHSILNLSPVTKLAIYLDYIRTNGFHRTIGKSCWAQVDQKTATYTINKVAKIFALKVGEVLWVEMEKLLLRLNRDFSTVREAAYGDGGRGDGSQSAQLHGIPQSLWGY